MSVTALCEEVTRRLRSQEPWEVEEIAERLGRVGGGEYSTPLLLNLAVAAILELSRWVNSTETPTSAPTWPSGGQPSELSEEDVDVVVAVLMRIATRHTGARVLRYQAAELIRALDECRARKA